MADEYDKNRAFGKRENLEKRLAMWANQLSMDKRYPWLGLGLIDDLKCASRELGGNPDKQYPDMRKPEARPVEGPVSTHGKPEYDL
jgi:hypothetical protein